jgi:hypothetical protein
MGPTADEMKRKAGRAGQEAMQRGQEVAQSAASAGMEEMERQGMTPDRVAEEARDAGSQMKEIAREKVPNPEQIREKAEQVAERSAETAKQESQRHVHEAQTRSNPR